MHWRVILPALLVALIASNASATQWRGEQRITAPITFTKGMHLTICPGTKITFSDNGQLIACNATIHAENASFTADAPFVNKSRFSFRETTCRFADCSFTNIITNKKRFHGAFFSIYGGEATFTDNTFSNCSALECKLCSKPDISWNLFTRCRNALVLFHTRYAYVRSNTFRACTANSLLLNSAENCLVVANRFHGPRTGISLYRDANDNMLCSNTVFAGTCAFEIRGFPRRNIFIRSSATGTTTGLRVWNTGPNNLLRNLRITGSAIGIIVKENKKKIPIALNDVTITRCDKAGLIKADGLHINDSTLDNNKSGFVLLNNATITKSNITNTTNKASPVMFGNSSAKKTKETSKKIETVGYPLDSSTHKIYDLYKKETPP